MILDIKFLNQLMYISFITDVRVHILSDSIAKYVKGTLFNTVFPLRGYTLQMMIDQIHTDPSLVKAPYMILHVGTSNINSREKFSVDDIVRLTNELLNVIWIHNPSAHIIVSSILHRPVDFCVTNEKVKLVNEDYN
jgi:hypothetical protein